jgi:hypothetical protein
MFDMACVATAEPEEIAAIFPALTLTHLDDLDARLRELAPIWVKQIAATVDPYPAFAPMIVNCCRVRDGRVHNGVYLFLPSAAIASGCPPIMEAAPARPTLAGCRSCRAVSSRPIP